MKSVQLVSTGSADGSRIFLYRIIEQVSQGDQVLYRCYNAGSHNTFLNYLALVDERGSLVTDMGERQRSKWTRTGGKIEAAYAKRLWDIVRVAGRRLLGFGH
jgi:hypothetical protein